MSETGNAEIILVYIIGTFGMIVLSGAVFLFFVTYQKRLLKKELEINIIKAQQQEEILRNTILSQEKERKRIAQDLHDEVGAMLSVIKLNISLFERKAENPKAREFARETKTYLDDVIIQVRRISRALMPPSLEKLGLAIAVEELADWINKSGLISIRLWRNSQAFRLGAKKELAIFRIIQEILNNAIKHSGASQIQIKMHYGTVYFAVSVQDNGKGFEPEKMVKTGLGLRNLESRARLIHALLKINSAPGRGTTAILCTNVQQHSDG
ncbi:MAG: sensor histidine kinase [Mariniphaga sp.]